jgi:hypothetical protein
MPWSGRARGVGNRQAAVHLFWINKLSLSIRARSVATVKPRQLTPAFYTACQRAAIASTENTKASSSIYRSVKLQCYF